MRDILITLFFVGVLPFVLAKPYIGVLVWSWISYMNPHRLTYGFAYNLPFAQIVFIVTLISMFVSKEKFKMPWTGLAKLWVFFIFWLCFTTALSIEPSYSFPELVRTLKIQLVVLLTLLIISNREQINHLVWVIVISLGFYGVKGGLFSIATGGNYRVWGPANSFIADNNTLALALIMTLPLMFYLYKITSNKYLRNAVLLSMLLTGLSIITSFSRGALLASSVMIFMLVLKSKKKAGIFVLMLALVPAILYFMPSSWYDRMSTIQTYEQDESAMGRLQAWEFAVDLASQRVVGAGFDAFSEANYNKYSPSVSNEIYNTSGRFQDAHSIYFEVLAEHGFIGLFIFILIGIVAIISANKIKKEVKKWPDLRWAGELAGMIQVSLIGYSVGGTFLGLAYYDLPYHLISILIILKGKILVEQQKKQLQKQTVVAE